SQGRPHPARLLEGRRAGGEGGVRARGRGVERGRAHDRGDQASRVSGDRGRGARHHRRGALDVREVLPRRRGAGAQGSLRALPGGDQPGHDRPRSGEGLAHAPRAAGEDGRVLLRLRRDPDPQLHVGGAADRGGPQPGAPLRGPGRRGGQRLRPAVDRAALRVRQGAHAGGIPAHGRPVRGGDAAGSRRALPEAHRVPPRAAGARGVVFTSRRARPVMIGPLVAAAILAGTGSGGFAAAGPVAAASGAHRADSDAPRASPIEWRPVIAGVTYAAIPIPRAVPLGDPHLHVVRIDPRKARLRAAMASEVDGRRRTAAEWCAGSNLAVAINLGMFQGAPLSNVGYARQGKHLDNSRWNAYRSALVFGARRSGIPPARLIDLDQPGARRQTDEYEAAVQNLRLIEAPGRNVWSRQTRRWSEAAIGMDAQGEILFLFCRSPFTMFE